MSDGGAQFKTFGPFFDDNGSLYRGIKLNVYAVGTTNDKTYWTDEDKSTPGTHPLVDSDSDGIVSAFFDGDYRIQVIDSSDNALDDAIDWDSYKITSDTATLWEGNQGTSYPSATASNRGHLFLLLDGSNNIIELGVNDGTAFRKIADASDLVSKTTTYTATTNEEVILCDASSGAWTLTLPAVSGLSGKTYTVIKTDSGANDVTVDGDGAETINGSTTFILDAQYDFIQVHCDGIEWFIGSQELITLTGKTLAGTTAITGTTTITGIFTLDPSVWPSFSVHKNTTDQSNITGNQLVTWSTELFDTNNDFISSRFTPTVAGKYLLTATLDWNSVTAGDRLIIRLHKNGTPFAERQDSGGATFVTQSITIVVDANGSSDYFEIFANNVDRDTSDISGAIIETWFAGSRIG